MSDPTRCLCGGETFYRVTVARRAGDSQAAFRTDLVACEACKLTYHSPASREQAGSGRLDSKPEAKK